MNKRVLGWLVAILVVVGVVYGVSQRKAGAPAPLPDKIQIGTLLPLSGDGAPYGLPVRRTIEMAVEKVNAAGGIAGKPVEMVWGDGQCDGQASATEAQKLVSVDGVTIIFGGYCSGETIAAGAITEPKRVLLISPGSSSPKISGIGDYVFRTYPSDALAGRVAAEYAAKVMNVRKVALITEQTDYAQGLRNAFMVTFGQFGGAVAADEVYQTGATDFRTQLTKIKQTNPDAIYLAPQTGNPGLLILQQAKELGIGGKRITAEVLMDRKIIKENAALMEGLVGIEAALDDMNPAVTAFLAEYKTKYGEDMGGIPLGNANGYQQVYLMKDAIEAVGYDTTKIKDWLYSLKEWQGPLGTLTFDRNGDPITGYFGIRAVTGGAPKTLGVQRLTNGDLLPFESAK